MRYMEDNERAAMWDRFDKIVCMHYLPYKQERWGHITSELERVGILNLPKFEFEYTVPSPFYDYLRFPKGMKSEKLSKVAKPYAIQYYTMMKKHLMLGAERMLVLEDDLAFHKDLDFIKKIIDATPQDWDIVNYDPFRRKGWLGNGKGFWGHYYDLNGNEVDKEWTGGLFMRYHSIVFRISAIAYSRKAIEQYVKKMEECLMYADGYCWKDTGDLNTYCTTGTNSICIQNRYDTMITSGDDGSMEHIYKGYPVQDYNFYQTSKDNG